MSTALRLASVPAFVALVASPVACSEGIPPASRGAYRVEMIQVSGGQGPCQTARTDGIVGTVSASAFEDLRTDGAAGTEMECAVFPNGDGTFNAEGELLLRDATANEFLNFRIPNLNPGATEANPSSGSISFRNTDTINLFQSPPDAPCSFWLEQSQEVAAGRIWVQFACSTVISGMQSCQIQRGTIAMDNCDQ